MQSKSAIAVALFATATPLVHAGSAIIKNQCHFPLYLWTVSNYQSEMKTIDVGGTFNEEYLTNPNGGGISMKIATNPTTAGAITQYEYTITGSDLWYDISNINGEPFTNWGFDLITSDSSCRNVICGSGVSNCDQVYNTPDQNEATAHCFASSDTTLTLCSSNKHSSAPANVNVVSKPQHNKHKKHHKHKNHNKGGAPAAPAPVPSVTSIVQPSVSVGAYGASTTFFTQVVTQYVTAREAAPTHEARHIHGHAHAHQRS